MEENLSARGLDGLADLLLGSRMDAGQLSPLTLAYIGDAAYELIIRTLLVREANMPVNKLHKKASGKVNAVFQSRMIETIEPLFSRAEAAIYRRGRNATSYTKAKHASTADYRRSTGFEAVMGYLYLRGDYSRMMELLETGLGAGSERTED